MTLQKAIEILTKAIENRYLPLCKDLDDATKLGIKALERERDRRDHRIPGWNALLPGETEE